MGPDTLQMYINYITQSRYEAQESDESGYIFANRTICKVHSKWGGAHP
jgi:hypothetical protein